METKKKYVVLLMAIVCISINSCAQQKGIPKLCRNAMSVDDARDVKDDDEGNILITDTLKKKVKIIFEQGFDDSIYVFVNEKFQFRKKIKTHQFLGTSLEDIDIDYSSYTDLPKISIVLEDKKNCVSFYPKRNKQIIYLNQSEGAWSIEASNILRSYR